VLASVRGSQTDESRTSFSARETADVEISVLFVPGRARQMAGVHSAQVVFFTPGGYVYESRDVLFSGEEKLRGTRQPMKGYPRPLNVNILADTHYGNRPYYVFRTILPLKGTLVVANSLYGLWKVEVYLDGERLPCANGLEMEIRE